MTAGIITCVAGDRLRVGQYVRLCKFDGRVYPGIWHPEGVAVEIGPVPTSPHSTGPMHVYRCDTCHERWAPGIYINAMGARQLAARLLLRRVP